MSRLFPIVFLLLCACARDQATTPVWSSLEPEDFSTPFEVQRSGEKRELKDCTTLVKAVREKFETENPADYAVFLATAERCLAHEAVAAAHPYTRSNWTPTDQLPAAALPGAGWESRTKLVAKGDFDGDSWEDRLYQVEQWATRGTNRQVRFVLCTKKDAAPVAILKQLAL
ncbi:MAG: hypothetical protein IT168_10660 [Bryobacterales bacterium]|nr:hypothetical protein [Bryobacterales bacterium]